MNSARTGSPQVVRMLLDAMADQERHHEDGCQALHVAAALGRVEVCQVLAVPSHVAQTLREEKSDEKLNGKRKEEEKDVKSS